MSSNNLTISIIEKSGVMSDLRDPFVENTLFSFINDVKSYGELVAVFEGEKIVQVGKAPTEIKKLETDLQRTFAGSKYAQIISRHIMHLYRVFDSLDDNSGASSAKTDIAPWQGNETFATRRGSKMFGKGHGIWLSPMRPTIMEEYRLFGAVKHEWSRMDFILSTSLLPGARIYVGRVASQSNIFHNIKNKLSGGAIQIWIPRDQIHYLGPSITWVAK